jgi:hypothetical protein
VTRASEFELPPRHLEPFLREVVRVVVGDDVVEGRSLAKIRDELDARRCPKTMSSRRHPGRRSSEQFSAVMTPFSE